MEASATNIAFEARAEAVEASSVFASDSKVGQYGSVYVSVYGSVLVYNVGDPSLPLGSPSVAKPPPPSPPIRLRLRLRLRVRVRVRVSSLTSTSAKALAF